MMRIVVVGAGIAGLATAHALAAVGLRCVVLEQADAPREDGFGIQIASAGARRLPQWGLSLDSFAVQPVARELRRWRDGALIARVPLAAPYYATRRSDLSRVLRAGVPVRYGAQCVGISETGAVLLSDGSCRPADLVIGADGLRSVVRGALSSDSVRRAGASAWRAVVRVDEVRWWSGSPRVIVWLGPGQHCVCYPIAPGLLNVVAVGSSFDDWHADVRALLDAARSPVRHDLFDRAPLARRVSGRIALVGDAAQPMLPYLAQGASQGIEDASALAACLASETDVPAALARYDAVRGPRAAAVAEAVRVAAREHHLPDGPEQRVRDRRLAAAARGGAER